MKKTINLMILLSSISLIIIGISFLLRNRVHEKTIAIPEDRLEKALNLAGENRNELIKVLDYYKHAPLKYKAAVFLIENMVGLSNTNYKIDLYYPVIDSMIKINTSDYERSVKIKKTHQLLSKEGVKGIDYRPGDQLDLQTIKSDFLIENIDLSFKAWQTGPWSLKCSFNDFCEYILPYRLIYPKWDNARKYFYEKYQDLPDSLIRLKNNYLIADYIKNDFKQWYNGKWDDCFHKDLLITIALRAIGIPTFFETVPNWGNMHSDHYFYRVLDREHDTITKLIDNRNIPRDTRHIISGSYFDEDVEHLLNSIDPKYQISFIKTIPKVFRNCFAIQYNSLAAIAPEDENIPAFFDNDRLMDVTDRYLETCNVKIKIEGQENNQFAYLCVFDRNGWIPVHWAKINRNKAVFKKMGKNIVYLPAIFRDDKIIPVAMPFVLTQNGKMKGLQPHKKTQSVDLYRKYFLSAHTIYNASECTGCKFQGTNSPDLSDTVTFYTIDKLAYSMTEVPVHDPNKYRYLIFQFAGKKKVSLGELEFYKSVNGNPELLSGEYIGNPGGKNKDASRLFDNDLLSYYANYAFSNDTYVGIDLGEGNSAQISKIKFCPRNDKNYITDGHLYELFYWDNEWVSLGYQKGKKSESLKYNNVPVGALLYLRDLTAGIEERIFIYEDGRQIWW